MYSLPWLWSSIRLTSILQELGQLFFDIEVPIIEVIIMRLLFNAAVKDVTLKRAFSVFFLIRPSDGLAVIHYCVQVKKTKLFKFRMMYRQIASVWMELSFGFLSGGNKKMVSPFVLIASEEDLQKMREILSKIWAFSVSFYSTAVVVTPYLDVRVCVALRTNVHCFHCFFLPLYGSNTDELLFDVFVQVMDALCPGWVDTILSFCADGAQNMQGVFFEIFGCSARCLTAAGYLLIRFWCGTHQLDLIKAKAVTTYSNESWYGTLNVLSEYLRRQQNLINKMWKNCPKVAFKRYLSLGNALPWFARHRIRFLEYIEENSLSCRPSDSWWTFFLALRRVLGKLNILVQSLQSGYFLVTQQKASFCSFIVFLCEKFSVQGLPSAAEVDAWHDT